LGIAFIDLWVRSGLVWAERVECSDCFVGLYLRDYLLLSLRHAHASNLARRSEPLSISIPVYEAIHGSFSQTVNAIPCGPIIAPAEWRAEADKIHPDSGSEQTNTHKNRKRKGNISEHGRSGMNGSRVSFLKEGGGLVLKKEKVYIEMLLPLLVVDLASRVGVSS
jgi:hypothetical protein